MTGAARRAGGLSAHPSPARVRDAAGRPPAGRVRRVPRAGRRGADHHRAGAGVGAAAGEAHPYYWRQRLTVARGFARHLATIDPASEVPSTDLLPGAPATDRPLHLHRAGDRGVDGGCRAAHDRRCARTSSDADRAAGGHRDAPGGGARARPRRRRSATRRGPRPRRQAATSSARSRCTPAPSPRCATTPACVTPASRHRQRRRSSSPRAVGGWAAHELNQTFTKLIREVGLDGRGARARPRPHDLRHAFAVRTLLDWYQAGEDVDRRMPLLSTYPRARRPGQHVLVPARRSPSCSQLISSRLERLPGVLS